MRVTTAVANATPNGTINIKKGSTAIGTYTVGTATVADNSGHLFVPASGYEGGVNLSAGDTFVIDTGSDGAATAGVYKVHLALYLAPLAR